MADLKWTADVDSWSTWLSNDVFEDLEVRVTTDGEDDPPTPRQLQAVKAIEQFSVADREKISALARQWGEENLEEDDLEDMEDEDFEFDMTSVVVPRLRHCEDVFFLFTGNSEMEPEHGLGCICKNGNQFAICPPDHAYDDFDWDAVDEWESLLQ
jgi:hypothetical protein